MKRNFTKKVFAMATAATLLAGIMPVSLLATDPAANATITFSDVTVTAAKFLISVPTSAGVELGLNPLLLGVTSTNYGTEGITSSELVFTNLSQLPVSIDVSVIPTIAKGTTLVGEAASGATGSLVTSTNKEMYLFAEFAKEIKGDGTSGSETDVDLEETTFDGDIAAFEATSTGGTAKSTSGISGSLDFRLVLDEAGYNAAGTTPLTLAGNGTIDLDDDSISAAGTATTGAAMFKFGGQVSSAADWKETDFGVSLVYDAKVIAIPAADGITNTIDGTGTPMSATALRAYEPVSGFEYKQILLPNKAIGTAVLTPIDDSDIKTITAVAFVTDMTGTTTAATTTTTGLTLAVGTAANSGVKTVRLTTAATFVSTTATTYYIRITYTDNTTSPVATGVTGKTVVYPITIVPLV